MDNHMHGHQTSICCYIMHTRFQLFFECVYIIAYFKLEKDYVTFKYQLTSVINIISLSAFPRFSVWADSSIAGYQFYTSEKDFLITGGENFEHQWTQCVIIITEGSYDLARPIRSWCWANSNVEHKKELKVHRTKRPINDKK